MIHKIKSISHLVSNMGWNYVLFRFRYELERKTGILQRKFPTNPPFQKFLKLDDWKQSKTIFFFNSKEDLIFSKNPSEKLKKDYEKIKNGVYTFFSALDFDLGENYDWITNPETKYQYSINQHCLSLENLSKEAGDIKYVWEKARFTFLYTLIRYDYHFNEDCSEEVFSEILDFIEKNPINQGPNYNCSQEISLRVFNWIFALYYYKNSKYLTEVIFQKIMNSIYWQIHHVYQNINFSRIAVRNNHAITETLALYCVPLLFPTMPNAEKWKKRGREWFEQEIKYQIYEDGTFLQFSMNYHRVVVQLLTWGINLAKNNNERFSETVYDKAYKSLLFLNSCQDNITGFLPNYGANDGALFFPLSNTEYRNYKPQLFALASTLEKPFIGNTNEDEREDFNWFQITKKAELKEIPKSKSYEYNLGGYYVIREENVITFVHCGKYKDRPSQADNLHLDIWVEGKNVLWDTGSYKYNTTEEDILYFNGTKGHNTIMIGNYDQMQKGLRFIWNNWIKEAEGKIKETDKDFEIEVQFKGFMEISSDVRHKRMILKKKNKLEWIVQDIITGDFNENLKMNWHLNPKYQDDIELSVKDLKLLKSKRYVSNIYGVKEESLNLHLETNKRSLLTNIKM
ncbi:MAG: heparinase II/III family protein [Flavobacteriales bacterium]